LLEKHRRLASCHSCNFEDPVDDIAGPPAKRQKIDSELDVISMDPFERLPEHFMNDALGYLNKKDLLSAMTVSKGWNEFINVRSVFADKFIFNPSAKLCPLPLMHNIFNEENKPRSYKHMVTPFNLRRPYFSVINPIQFYASTLETLELKDVEEGSDFSTYDDEGYKASLSNDVEVWIPERVDLLSKPCNFLKLRKLTQSLRTPLDNLQSSTFPVLTHLQFKVENPTRQYVRYGKEEIETEIKFSEILKVFRLFPKLEVFVMDLDEQLGYNWEKELADDENRYLPKIKAMYLPVYLPEIMNKETLEKLEVCNMDFIDNDYDFEQQLTGDVLNELLQDFKALKYLSIKSINFSTEDAGLGYESSESIEILKIFGINYYNKRVSVQRCLRELLGALPSLKELVLHSEYNNDKMVTEEMLKFIGKKSVKIIKTSLHFMTIFFI
jgi:hypothetical protein